jgi:DNA-binding PadR family transcriptional regulator
MAYIAERGENELPTEELPATAYAVLGILSVNDEELSAAEIKTRATYSMRHFYWSPAVSHIRRELRRLRALGLVEEREIKIGRVRCSQLYQTTKAGEEVLARWVGKSSPNEPVVVKNSVLLRVYLGGTAPLDTILSVVNSRIAQVEEAIEEFNWGLRRASELDLPQGSNLRFPMAVGDFTLRSLYFEKANLHQLHDTIVGFDTETFRQDTTRHRGPLRPKRQESGS